MLRKLLLPVFAIVLLGGCMTGGYSYRQDRGDYYYGQPGVDYRYYDQYGSGYYDPRYRYPGYYPDYYGYGSRYGYGGYGIYGYGGFPGYYRPPVIVVRPGHGHGNNHGNHNNRPPRPDGDRDNNRAPWRDYERLQRERIQRSTPPPAGNSTLRSPIPAQVRPAAPLNRSVAPSAPRSDDRGSRIDNAMQRARSSRQKE